MPELRKLGVAATDVKDPVKVLIIEDDSSDAHLLQHFLSRPRGAHFEVRSVQRLAKGIELLQTGWPDILFLDLSLPDSHGVETVSRARAAAPAVPIIVLTGLPEAHLADPEVHESVQDYLVKDEVSAPVLLRALRHAIEKKALQRQIEGRDRLLGAVQAAVGPRAFRLGRDGGARLLAGGAERRLGDVAPPELVKPLMACFDHPLLDGERAVVAAGGRVAHVATSAHDELVVVLV